MKGEMSDNIVHRITCDINYSDCVYVTRYNELILIVTRIYKQNVNDSFLSLLFGEFRKLVKMKRYRDWLGRYNKRFSES